MIIWKSWTHPGSIGHPQMAFNLAHHSMTVDNEAERAKVVARFRNGRVIKGFCQNFFVNKDRFHLFPPDNPWQSMGIIMRDLKAVFFVRDFTGDSNYREKKAYPDGERPRGHQVEITFADGEIMVGSTLGYGPNREGFFIVPADPMSNNVKVYALSAAVQRIRRLT